VTNVPSHALGLAMVFNNVPLKPWDTDTKATTDGKRGPLKAWGIADLDRLNNQRGTRESGRASRDSWHGTHEINEKRREALARD